MSNGLINRQYVGARYVPKVMGEWNKALQYEALSVVTYMGNSFTSKVPVPANVEIDNEDYWVNTGNFNAQVEQYRQETISYKNEVDSLKKQKMTIANRKFLFIGDSYAVGYNPDETAIGYVDRIITTLELVLNTNAFKSVASGYGFSNSNGQFITLLNNANISDKTSITDIIVCGGTNDAFVESSTIISDITSFCTKAKELYPNALVSVGMVAGNKDISIKNALPRMVECYQSANLHNNACYITNSEYILCDKRYISSDKTHPLNSGYSEIAKYLINYIRCGSIDVFHKDETLSTTWKNLALNWSQNNGMETIYINGSLTNIPYGGVYGNQWQNLFSLNKMPFNGYGETFASGSCIVKRVDSGQTTYYTYPIIFRCTDTNFEYMICTGSDITHDHVESIKINVGYLSLPAMQM